MTEQEIERCLGRFTIGKATDVMNFDYSGTLAYLQRLKAENDELKEAEHRAEVAERALRNAATRLKCRGGLGKGFCRVDKCNYYHCNNDNGCIKAHLEQAEKELAGKGNEKTLPKLSEL